MPVPLNSDYFLFRRLDTDSLLIFKGLNIKYFMKTKKIIFIFIGLMLFYNSLFAGSGNTKEPQYFFVGTYTDSGSEGIYSFSLDRVSGKLNNYGLAAKSENASFLALSSNNKLLLAVNETNDEHNHNMGYVSSYLIKKSEHHLKFLNKVPSGGADPCYVSANQSGYVLAANYTGGNVALFRLDDSGTLGGFVDLQQHFGHGPNKERQMEPHVHSAFFEPFTDRVFVSDLGTDQVSVYLLEKASSKLVNAPTPVINIAPGSGPRHLAFHPKMKIVYVINELSNDITVVSSGKDGSFQVLETISTLPAGNDKPSYCADIHISKDGRFLYASNRGYNSIAIFSVDPVSGKLHLIGQEPTRGDFPRNFTLSPNEDFLLVANQNSQDIVSFRRDEITGKLQFADQVKAFKPVCLLFCRDETK